MDYKLCYDRLVQNAKERNVVDGYVEVHHIIPKSHGGSDDNSNLVKLTAREEIKEDAAKKIQDYVHAVKRQENSVSDNREVL